MAYVNKAKAILDGEGYHMVITTNIPAKRLAR
jgi:hypothetical protein